MTSRGPVFLHQTSQRFWVLRHFPRLTRDLSLRKAWLFLSSREHCTKEGSRWSIHARSICVPFTSSMSPLLGSHRGYGVRVNVSFTVIVPGVAVGTASRSGLLVAIP